MNGYQPKRFPKVRALVGVVVVLLLLQASVSVFSAPPPPSWAPPTIYKHSPATLIGIGDQVSFTVTVTNRQSPDPPQVPVTWHNVKVTDVLSSSLTIDDVSVQGDYDFDVTVENTVVVVADTLEPGQWFVISITCTVSSWPEPDGVIINTALIEFEDAQGSPGKPALSNPVTIVIEPEDEPLFLVMLPIIPRHHSP